MMPKRPHNKTTSKHIALFTRTDGFLVPKNFKKKPILLLQCVFNMNIIYLKLPPKKTQSHTF